MAEALGQLSSPSELFYFLAKALPPRAIFFIQLIIVNSVIGLASEMLRLTAFIQCNIRKYVGPNLTSEEKDEPFLALRPLANPRYFLYAIVFSYITLYFMILLTFAVIAPLTCGVLAFAFFVTEVCYRHQLIYIYPVKDSGGEIWMKFIVYLLICMTVSVGILLTYMAVVNANMEFFMLIPLVVMIALFVVYVFRRHFRVARHLSSVDSVKFDIINNLDEGAVFEHFRDSYRHPALLAGIEEEQLGEVPAINDEEDGASTNKDTRQQRYTKMMSFEFLEQTLHGNLAKVKKDLEQF